MSVATAARDQVARRLPPGPPATLLVPAGLVALLAAVPVVYLVVMAIGADRSALDLVARPRTLDVLWRTVTLAGAVTAAGIALGVPLAWLTLRTDLPGRRFWAVATVLPLVIPSYVGGYALVAALGPRGALQSLLAPLGVERLPEIYGFGGAALALTLFTFPYVLLAVRGALAGLDPAYEEVARSLGRGPWRTFLTVTLPQLRPAMAAGGLLVALYVLSDFGAVSLLQFDSFTRAIYVQYRASFDRTLAAVLALMLVGLTLLILLAESRIRGRSRYFRSGAGVRRPPHPVQLGGWRYPALAFCALVVGLAIVVPIGTIVFWLVRGLAVGEPLRLVWGAAGNSVLVAGMTAAVAAAAAIPVALLSVRHAGSPTALMERAVYSGYALPGIVIGLALVFIGAQWMPWLYQTLPLLIVGYLIRFLPQAVGATRASLLQLSPRLDEAARSLGQSPRAVFRRVTLPIIRPGVGAGAALVFLTTMKELPTTVLLAPTGFDTLAVRIWSASAEGFFARAAAPALLMVAVAALSLLLLVRLERPE